MFGSQGVTIHIQIYELPNICNSYHIQGVPESILISLSRNLGVVLKGKFQNTRLQAFANERSVGFKIQDSIQGLERSS